MNECCSRNDRVALRPCPRHLQCSAGQNHIEPDRQDSPFELWPENRSSKLEVRALGTDSWWLPQFLKQLLSFFRGLRAGKLFHDLGKSSFRSALLIVLDELFGKAKL